MWRRKKVACKPYEGLARIYDYLMRHINYQEWADYIEGIFSILGVRPEDILELACGTGTLALELARRGYNVSGTDASEAMIMIARQKACEIGIQVRFERMDMRYINTSKQFSAVLCLYDSINYLRTEEELRKTLEGVSSILHPGGLFIFDICTEANSLRHFRDIREAGKGDGFLYQRHSFYDPASKIHTNEFQVRFDGEPVIFTEFHQQRIYSLVELIDEINSSPLNLIELYDGFTFQKGTEDSDRVHFVLRKEASQPP